jgi:hypothetical protein
MQTDGKLRVVYAPAGVRTVGSSQTWGDAIWQAVW